MIDDREIAVGARVRLRSSSHVLDLRANTGSIAGRDAWDDGYLIRLDQPALYHHADGRVEELAEIVEMVDNFDVLPN